MANWQTPKTDWAAEDGVLNTDFNRIEENIEYLYDRPTALTANVTVYVSTSGNDTTGDGTSATPYATIMKALSVIPKNLNGFDATLSIAAGVYSEGVVIKGYTGGHILVNGGGAITVQYLRIISSNVFLDSGTWTITPLTSIEALWLERGATLQSSAAITITAGSSGITAFVNSSFTSIDTVTISNVNTAVISSVDSGVHLTRVAGASNNTGLAAYNNARISFSGNELSANVAYVTGNGGKIYSGGQTSIPNY